MDNGIFNTNDGIQILCCSPKQHCIVVNIYMDENILIEFNSIEYCQMPNLPDVLHHKKNINVLCAFFHSLIHCCCCCYFARSHSHILFNLQKRLLITQILIFNAHDILLLSHTRLITGFKRINLF